MKPRSKTTKSMLEYVNTPEKVRELTSLVPDEYKSIVKELTRTSKETGLDWPESLAAYYNRLANWIVQLESNQSSKLKSFAPAGLYHTYEIGFDPHTDEAGRAPFGPCRIQYFGQAEGHGEWGGCLLLRPPQSGVSFLFWDGLPVGASVSVFLKNWSLGKRKADLVPGNAAEPGKTSASRDTPPKAPDFRWKIVKRVAPTLIFIKNTTENDTLRVGPSGGAFCHCFLPRTAVRHRKSGKP
jgi:hypothetical protein